MILFTLLLACAPTTPDPAAPEEPQGGDDTAAPTETPGLSLTALDGSALSDAEQGALAAAPAWLRADLELAFRRVDADTAAELATLIVDLDDPWLTDELAFTLAHLSPELLMDEDFDPALLVENVTWVRDVDAELAYVELIDSGEPGVDDDYSTTARYVVEVDGALTTLDLPAEYYYWYIVHPRIEDEHPLYIDAWQRCRKGSMECPTTSEEGAFWRAWLWQDAAEDCPEGEWCPVLGDQMADVSYLWSTDGGGVGAVGEIARFMLSSDDTLGRWLSFGAGSERSIQPNRIYGLGAGNCGEWSDMTTALSRLALIPTYNVVPSSWDHTWNAFYDPAGERWVRWEPVNWWFDHDYGAPFANHMTRGDASVQMVTEDDTANWFTMEVAVTDALGAPIDGAVVSVWSPYESYWWYAGEQATDEAGVARFSLTAGQSFAYRVDSAIGGFPTNSNQITYGSEGVAAGETDRIDASIDATLPAAPLSVAMEADPAPTARLSINGELREGRILAESFAYGPDTFTLESDPPPVRWFVTDEAGYTAWLAGEQVPVLAEGLLGEEGGVELDASAGRVLVISNEDALNTAAIGRVSAALTALSGGDTPALYVQDLVLPPGDHRAVLLGG